MKKTIWNKEIPMRISLINVYYVCEEYMIFLLDFFIPVGLPMSGRPRAPWVKVPKRRTDLGEVGALDNRTVYKFLTRKTVNLLTR